jgi:hypothetical protein
MKRVRDAGWQKSKEGVSKKVRFFLEVEGT